MASDTSLYPGPPDQIVPLLFTPYASTGPSDELCATLQPVIDELKCRNADILVSAEPRPTWFSWLAAAAVQPRDALFCSQATEPGEYVSFLLERLHLSRVPLRRIPCTVDTHERERYRLLVEALGSEYTTAFPWKMPARILTSADELLRKLGLRSREYLVCFPTGSPTTMLKRWPESAFHPIMEALKDWGLPVLLIGESGERELLERLAEPLRLSGPGIGMFCGGPDDIPVVAALVSLAKAYLGNDTGPMHLAAAYEIPGVAIYGGGHWPSYGPWARGSVALLHPLPCFQCNWDCAFGHGLCVEYVPVDAVKKALKEVLAQPSDAPRVEKISTVDSRLENVIEAASASYRAVQKDRAERQDVIFGLQRAAARIHEQQERAEQMAAERLVAIQEKEQVISQLRAELDARGSVLNDVHGQLERAIATVNEQHQRAVVLEKSATERLAAMQDRDREIEARE